EGARERPGDRREDVAVQEPARDAGREEERRYGERAEAVGAEPGEAPTLRGEGIAPCPELGDPSRRGIAGEHMLDVRLQRGNARLRRGQLVPVRVRAVAHARVDGFPRGNIPRIQLAPAARG